jgi:arginine-tRNA-protein transferase
MAIHTDASDDLRLFQTGQHACGYWPERQARDLVLDPHDPRLGALYPLALSWGFRRSGDLVYRPHCDHCRACVAVRIPVAEFVPDRSQRRCLARNADINIRIVAA